MEVFNLAEKLEKERKKNKELEERIQFVVYKNNELLDRILKAIEYIKEHSTTIDYKTMRADYNLNMNDLLNILKGD